MNSNDYVNDNDIIAVTNTNNCDLKNNDDNDKGEDEKCGFHH